jgi:threonine dehydratase
MIITLDDVKQARKRLAGVAVHTPLVTCFGSKDGEKVWFKPENLQRTGSFKLRGAYNKISALLQEGQINGVIAYSSGNHAQGVACAAQMLGVKATIVMPSNAPKVKIEGTRSYGAEVVLYDPNTQRREEVAAKIQSEHNYSLVPPFDDPFIMAGQGTAGLEIAEDLPEVELVLVPVGGGGLVSGIATAVKQLRPKAKVVGIEPELAADARESFRTGKIVELTPAEVARTIADGVRTLHVGDFTLPQMREMVDDIITVSEDEIRDAMRRIVKQVKLVVEPTGALPFAALLHHRNELPASRNTVCVISGGNVEPSMLAEIIGNE